MRSTLESPAPTDNAMISNSGLSILRFETSTDACKRVAREIASLIRLRASEHRKCVLGLATGSTPIRVYRELVRMHREDGLSFHNVITFNLDEYYPIKPEAAQSYVRFMNEHFFNHIDIFRSNIHIPKGNIELESVPGYCRDYEELILKNGGIDLQLLGIGRTGHIGFNEPGATRDSSTRLVKLDSLTRIDAAADFGGLDNVPLLAITMGVETILQAKRIRLLAFGQHKASIVQKAIEGRMTTAIPATLLQNHRNLQYLLDHDAAACLSRTRSGAPTQ
ncbi:glucosamine-6-phosphate deaminase [Aporhodopirellula aestuarii]|uniref:Glucosamine-6-phosphate deaminase n=1 Tax=Aporhodopirellula aestuarii TaxID=2950107 RepID=A0ABT0U5J7_9BACT|nr:glucosamine-6-phosphate deaminase [Aporhodopirellula aestuarii]MCM2372126.1 glucosamine-6-phosphate deaminase [Aporhodopirellula aestuarii]